MSEASISAEELRQIENYLNGYMFYQKFLRMDVYEKEFLQIEEWKREINGEIGIARARMFEIRHFIMEMKNSDEKLLLYYHYVKGQTVERCAELLGISRASAFRMRKRALVLAHEHRIQKEQGK